MATELKAEGLLAQLAAINPTSLDSDPGQKMEALKLSKQLTAMLEAPVDRAVDYIFKPFSFVALRLAVGLNLFEHICTAQSPISSTELAKLSGGEEILISRILRVVASIGFVTQTSSYTWLANPTTHAMALPPIAAGYRCDMLTRSAMSGAEYLSQRSWKNPSEPRDALLQYAFKTKMNLFEFLASQPALFADFNLFMGATMGTQPIWLDWYDVQGRLIAGAKDDEVLLVDVGGGKGHDVQVFNERFGKEGKGGLVLQDTPGVIEDIGDDALDGRIRKMGHDFFEPQPVKGARVYFLHHILHDWSDKYCVQILKYLRDAMTPGYSKLIIHDLVLPDMEVSEMQARFDLAMMTINSGMERSAQQFTELLAEAGLKVTSVWSWPDKDGVIEAEVEIAV
ncbi:putative O-methyltransferase [Phaeosphaeria sp. MPI-PUGE-AT-0046c]|nr:putative O-methyltransferase [Phaeosphaeria sp. MPI-PUGE-AT-0046c]